MGKDEVKKVQPFMAIFGEDYEEELNKNEDKANQDTLKIEQLVPFKNHPFKLYEGERLDEMVESIKQFGVIVPIVVRKKKLKFEILSGHNRVEACKVLGYKEIPAIIKEGLTEEEATLVVTETNTMQRSFADLLHSERATVVAVRHEAMKKQGFRTDLIEEIEKLSKSPNLDQGLTSSPMAKKLNTTTMDKVGQEFGLGKDSIARYLRISKLPDEFKELVDTGQIAIRAGVDLSYLREESLDIVHAIVTEENFKIDMNRARNLRGADKKAPLTFESAHAIIKGEKKDNEKKPKPPKYWNKVFIKYFRPEQEEAEVTSIIEKALAMYYKSLEEASHTRLQNDRTGIPRTHTGSIEQSNGDREVRKQSHELPKGRVPTQIQPSQGRGNTDGNHVQGERGSTPEDGATTGADVKNRTNTESRELLRDLQTRGNDKNESGGNRTSRDRIQIEIETHIESSDDDSFSLSKIRNQQIIDCELAKGSGFQDGKQRIVDFFVGDATAKEKAEFLKNEYGIGGGTLLFYNHDETLVPQFESIGLSEHDSKGIRLKINDGREIKLSWAKVVKGIEKLIQNGNYFKPRYKGDTPPIPHVDSQPTLFDTMNNHAEDHTKDSLISDEEDKALDDLIGDYNIPDEVNEMQIAKTKSTAQSKSNTRKPNTIPHRNYKKLTGMATGIIEGRYSYLKLKAKGFMDLTIEKLSHDRISITHHYIQNGDLMRDPDIEMIIDHERETLMAATFRQDSLGIFQQVYLEDNRWSPKLSKKLNSFLNEWLGNIELQRYNPFEAHLLEI